MCFVIFQLEVKHFIAVNENLITFRSFRHYFLNYPIMCFCDYDNIIFKSATENDH